MPPLFAPIIQLFLTIYYFFYFLAKGKPEWKCSKENHGDADFRIKKVCCDGEELSSTYMQQNVERGVYVKIVAIPSTIYHYGIRFVEWAKEVCRSIKSFFSTQSIRKGLKRIGASVVSLLVSAWQIISTSFSTLFSFLIFRRAPSKTMPTSDIIYSPNGERDVKLIRSPPIASTPVLYSPSSPSSPSIPPPPPPPPPPSRSTRVPSSHKEEIMSIHDETPLESNGTFKEGAFYSTRVFAMNEEKDIKNSPVKAFPSMKDSVKGGIAVFPPSMMAEIAGSGGRSEQVKRSEVNRTPNPTVKERLRDASLTPTHKGTFEYAVGNIPNLQTDFIEGSVSKSRIDTPKGWRSYQADRERAKSAGPPRVSRIEDSSSNEAQFIFRPHGSNEDVGYNYSMGSCVYHPVAEIEKMRPTMNRHVDSRATTPSIWSCNNSRVSTPALNPREDESGRRQRGRSCQSRGRVGDTARSWPPPPNAEGADIGKECFVDGNGIVTTTCTRIVQKKNEESWRSYDNNGHVIDEKKEFSLMGDRDELRREGPFQANHFSQHYFLDRDGVTRFENTHRQYDKDYVVESVCRNY